MSFVFRRSSVYLAPAAALTVALTGCASLPSSGPTGSQIIHAERGTQSASEFDIVEINSLSDLPQPALLPTLLTRQTPAPPTDLIGPGDILDVSIYETGVSLFSGSAFANSLGDGANTASQIKNLSLTRVDDNGEIRVPFAGTLMASGRTTAQLSGQIARALRGKSQDPQVIVTIRESITNSVLVGGEVSKPGRLALSTNRETLSDVLALAGSYRGDSKDYSVRVQRGNDEASFRLSDVQSTTNRDMRIFPGDKISLVREPQSFSVMGAPGKVDQIVFNAPTVSLAQAISMAGGSNPNIGDPEAIFVFRYDKNVSGENKPIVYHVNMMKAQSYFLTQRFNMTDGDVLYIGNARANQPSKLIQIVSQLFAPIITVRNIVSNN